MILLNSSYTDDTMSAADRRARMVRRAGSNGHEMGIKKRAGVVGGVHNRTPPAARRVGEKKNREYDSFGNVT